MTDEENIYEEEGELKASDRSLLSSKLPIDQIILNDALNLALDRDARISDIATEMQNDPILALEVIGHANKAYGFDKSGISSLQNSIVRIGSENLVSLLRELKTRPVITDQEVALEFEKLRILSIKANKVSGIISYHINRDVQELSQSCALFSYIGQMVSCYYLGSRYLEFSIIKKKSALIYKIKSVYNIDLLKIHTQFLRDRGLPSLMFYAFDRDLKCKTAAQSALRFITDSTLEILEAVEDKKWDKYLSPAKFPTKSNLRLLKITENTYSKIREEIEETLEISQIHLNKDSYQQNLTKKEDSLNYSIQGDPTSTLILNRTELSGSDQKLEELNLNETLVISREGLYNSLEDSKPIDFNIKDIETENGTVKGYKVSDLSVDAQALVGLMGYVCEEATSVSNLIKDLMQILTEQGPFSRSALIEMIEPKKWGEIHTALGEDFELMPKGTKIDITDPLSPLSTLATKIGSFNCKESDDNISPFGISSYAISTLELSTDKKLILYADCGSDRPVPLEARKMFRLVLNMLNEVLPRVIKKSIDRQSTK